ncbi:MAG: NAD(P)/FAD-dependent oxidoreductase [Aquaticitalea sp.]
MKQVDYIIVGCGLAGIAFCEQLIQNKKSFIVFDNHSQLSSIVAAGIYNPVTLKRFTEVWYAKKQLELALPFYKELEIKLKSQLIYEIPIYRRFASIEEQNDWFSASDKPSLEPYLSTKMIKNDNSSVKALHGFGKVLQTGRIDTAALIEKYKNYLKNIDSYCNKTFEYDALSSSSSTLNYNQINSKYIVFAEGYGMTINPYFNYLPLNEAKGEVIIIKAPDLKIDYILKSSIFVVPEGNDLYSVGATYNWDDKTQQTTEAAKLELTSKLKDLISCDFEVVSQKAGIRPTVKDRRPLVGLHAQNDRIAILNGLGTRGVMIAPYVAKALYEKIEQSIPLVKEIDIIRF